MRVFLKKETNIIDITEQDSVSLEGISQNSDLFLYNVSYIVDPKRAMQKEALVVKISATEILPVRKNSNMFVSKNPDTIIKNILQKNSLSKDSGRSQVGNFFFSYRSDITSRIPNDKTNTLGRNFLGLGKFLSTSKVVKLKSTDELKSSNSSMPVLENNISTNILSQESANNQVERNTSVARSVSTTLIFGRSIDPATISGGRTNTIQSARKVAGGIISKPSTNTKNLNDTQKVSLLGNLVNSVNPQNTSQFANTFVNVIIDQPSNSIVIKELLEIPISLLQLDEFYLVFELTNKSGIVVQEFNISVPHSSNVAKLKIPTLPPLIEVLQRGISAKNIISVKQVDNNATGIALYRKENKVGIPIISSEYTLVGKVETVKGDDFRRIEDIVNNYNSILYRAIPYNSSGILSSEFSGKGSQPLKIKIKPQNRRRNFISLAGSVTTSGIVIEIRDVPSGVCSLSLFSRDKSNFQKTKTLVTGQIQIGNEETSAAIVLVDSSVKNGRIYEYFCELLYPDGTVVVGSTTLNIKFNPISSNIVSTSISAPLVEQDGEVFNATFDISSNLVKSSQDQIKKALELQGLSGFFSDSLSKEKEKLQNIIAYNIKRTNVTLGTVEDFGIVVDGAFSDKDSGNSKGVLPLEAGFEYKYEISTFFRSAETSLENSTRTVDVTQNISYDFKPSKWLHPYTLKNGTILTTRSVVRNHAETSFSFGAVGDVTNTTVSLAKILPSIVESKAQKLTKNSTLVQWRVQGNITKIDHFIVTLEILGMKTVVGKSHNISESNYFQFVDTLDDGEHGLLRYTIVPVYYDYTRGTEVVTNEVII